MNKTNVLNAKRYRVEDSQGRYLYVTICIDPTIGTPYELWVTVPDENKAVEQDVRTSATMIAALFSEARQAGVPYTKLYKSMDEVCYSKASIPARILRLLAKDCPIKEAEAKEFEYASERQEENNVV